MKVSANEYLDSAIKDLFKDVLSVSFSKPLTLFKFISSFAYQKKAVRKRREPLKDGISVPPFIIASISNTCNLACKGCYAGVNQSGCSDVLSSVQWHSILREADSLGVSFILLAGGEPFMRFDVLRAAAEIKNVIFPVFTNGLMIDDIRLRFLRKNRNIIPILSLEGGRGFTDARRGMGTYDKLNVIMDDFMRERIFYGVSVTVTAENLAAVTSDDFVRWLSSKGCSIAFYIEYVPVQDIEGYSAFGDAEREELEHKLKGLNKKHNKKHKTILVSFPGDEKLSGGCLAAGRGFVHINPSGGLEPCPFSPHSDVNLKDLSLRDALKSPLLSSLRESGMLTAPHTGGCVLWDRRSEVESLVGSIGK